MFFVKSKSGAGYWPALLLMGAGVLWAAQPWGKDPNRWTAEDARHILLDSPWAQPGTALFGKELTPEDVPAAPLPAAAEAGMAGSRPVSGDNWDGGPGRDTAGRTPTLPVVVRWDSALPVREAIQKLPPGDRTPGDVFAEAQLTKDYILTVTGLVPAGRYTSTGQLQKQSTSDDNDNGFKPQDPEPLLEGLMNTSRLVLHDGEPIRPDDVKLEAATGIIHVFFPRAVAIRPDAKEVTFYTQFGSMRVSQKFRLKEMKYEGRLEL